MSFSIARDARPQVRTLLIALAVTVVLGFIPFADILTYPFRLFVTFIHEGGHAVAAILTGSDVGVLRVNPNGSGFVTASGGGRLSQLFLYSAGYLGAMAFGALLLTLIRRAVAVRAVLYGTAAYILSLTLFFGLGSLFTLVAGVALALGLWATARYATLPVANFLVAFLAIQCVVGALFDLRTLLTYSSPFVGGPSTDADGMASVTGLPPIFWALAWTLIAVAILVASLRAYAGHTSADLPARPARRYRDLRV